MSIIEKKEQDADMMVLKVMADRILSIEKNVLSFALGGAVEIGKILTEVKEKVGHGNFGNWCEANLNYSQKKAQRLMKIAQEYGNENSAYAKATNSSDLSVSKALSLLAVPENEVENFVKENDIESMSFKELEAEIKQLKAEKLKAETKEKDLQEQIARSNLETEGLRAKIIALEGKIAEAENQPAEVDNELVDQLEKEAEALKEALAKAENDLVVSKEKLKIEKNKVKDAEAKKEKEIQEAISEREQEIRDESKAELEQLKVEKRQLQNKLEKAGNDSIIKFKILTDQLQDVFDQCGNCILDEEDPDRAEKMNKAMKMIVEKFMADL